MTIVANKVAFISYAREDHKYVDVAVALLKAGGANVFRDINDLDFGDKWEDVLIDHISQCERMLVFWSQASSRSIWVEREWRLALCLDKRIIPIALDETPFPPELGQFHGIPDLHKILIANYEVAQAGPQEIEFGFDEHSWHSVCIPFERLESTEVSGKAFVDLVFPNT